jgi:hypothetical protein
MMEILEANIECIPEYHQNNLTYQEISESFHENFPEVRRGFSVRSIRLVCTKHGLKKTSDAEIDEIVQRCVNEVKQT